MEQRIPNLFKQALSLIDDDPNYCHEKQNINHSSGFRCYPRQPSDARINFSKNNVEIIRLVNASGPPYSGAYCYYNNEMIYIMEAELYKDFEKYYVVDKVNGDSVVIFGVTYSHNKNSRPEKEESKKGTRILNPDVAWLKITGQYIMPLRNAFEARPLNFSYVYKRQTS